MKKISSEKLGRFIEARRESAGYTQEELGKKTDINRQVIGRIEHEKYIPSIHQLNRLMAVLDFDLSEITEENEDRNTFIAMMGEAETPNEKVWLDDMVSMMLVLRKHYRIGDALNETNTINP